MKNMLLILGCTCILSCNDDKTSNDFIDSDEVYVTHSRLRMSFSDENRAKGLVSGNLEIYNLFSNNSMFIMPFDLIVKFENESIIKRSITSFPATIPLPVIRTADKGVHTLNITMASPKYSLITHKVKFRDMYGETDMNGPGGNAIQNWIYGLERPSLNVSRLDNSCIFDNGVVAIVDMQNTLGSEKSGLLPNQIDELAYPPYHFDCSHSTYHSERPIVENGKHWTYSTLNDALYYGTIVHDMFVHYLGEPPLNHKIWLRVHYGPRSSIRAFWDGAYANFSDAYPFQFSTASLDIIAHEIAHGVLLRLSHMSYSSPLSVDAQTISEAFSDISGVMAKHWVDPSQNIWWHGSETDGYIRKLDRIKTEASAVSSYLDYDSAGNNPYLRIGLMSYPFYLLAEKWNIETAYLVYLQAARSWTPDITLVEAANSILEAAGYLGYQTSDVVDAFEAIKLPLP